MNIETAAIAASIITETLISLGIEHQTDVDISSAGREGQWFWDLPIDDLTSVFAMLAIDGQPGTLFIDVRSAGETVERLGEVTIKAPGAAIATAAIVRAFTLAGLGHAIA